MSFLLIGLGGMLGALCRFHFGRLISLKFDAAFPLGTFVINVTGAVLLGLLTSVDAGDGVYFLLGDGFLGAYTTFSTFMYEGINLFRVKRHLNMIIYVLGTIFSGIVGYAWGYEIGKSIIGVS